MSKKKFLNQIPPITYIPPPTMEEIRRQLKKVVTAEQYLDHRGREFLECLSMQYVMEWILRGGTGGPETCCSVIKGLELKKRARK